MATDIAPALLEQIQKRFQSRMMGDRELARISNKIRDGTATLYDGHFYSVRTGKHLSEALRDVLTENDLPNGTLYFNIANRTVVPALKETYGIVNDIDSQIQGAIDVKAKIGLRSVAADFPEERIKGLIDKMTEEGIEFDEVLKWLGEPIINNTEAFHDDFIKENARFRESVGLKSKIIRRAEANCCDWCANLEGSYDYGNVPPEVYARHEYCRCDVVFESGRSRQNVWSKESWSSTPEQIEARKEAGR